MATGARWLLLALGALASCTAQPTSSMNGQATSSTNGQAAAPTMTPDEQRNAEFWREVATIHFTEDRSHHGERAPAVLMQDAAGHSTSLAAYRGRPTLVNLWAHWCVPCRAEMPTIDAMAGQRGAALQVVAVNEDAVRPTSPSLGPVAIAASVTQLTDRSAVLKHSLASGGLPTTVLYDSGGREVWRLVGVLDWTKDQARHLLDEAR